MKALLDVAIRRGGGGTVATSGTRTLAQGLFWAWVLHAALALFVGWQVARAGGWALLVERDPSRISLLIVALALAVTAWCGRRAWRLAREAAPDGEWARLWRLEGGGADPQAAQRLAERSHGPHETAWWFAASAIKLGLLGTVVGFIVTASRLAASQVFELAEVQLLLKQMTEGMAIALYTTLVGLVANLWLGLQLLLLDRLADRVAASIAGGELG
ncbi:MotA/TolQ/ExbB proton channel family protein [Azohydromonas sediminis]|uniref:MotA/TolQ/ExbB proton channel family protein n=1 Tax=Azohydromonas sediminis TaxID=2259674 RepID=UPI0013C2E4E2|nr:MotA/TolQ/ExbB proton channel family protein [Azohydromonas sediminis]